MREDRSTIAGDPPESKMLSEGHAGKGAVGEAGKVMGSGGGMPVNYGSGDQGAKPMPDNKGGFKPSDTAGSTGGSYN